jgi:hypothetical protein
MGQPQGPSAQLLDRLGLAAPSGTIQNFSWSDDSKLHFIVLSTDQIVVFCQEGSNKLYFSRVDTGAFIKSYSICDEGTTVTDVSFTNLDSTKVAYGCSDG